MREWILVKKKQKKGEGKRFLWRRKKGGKGWKPRSFLPKASFNF
jgi:hypothetical protein